jgi:predicted N-acetyltransferase YhbS
MPEELREARDGELEAVYELRGRAFGADDPDGEESSAPWFAWHDREDPWRAAGANYVALVDGQLVATVRVFARRITLGQATVAVAGFGDVATDPLAQGRGHMRRLLSYANTQNEARGFDLGLLFTGVPRVYEGAGFRLVPTAWYSLPLPLPSTAVLPGSSRRWSIAPSGTDALPALRAVYEEFGRNRPGYPVRDDAYWAARARQGEQEERGWLRVARDERGVVASYLLARHSFWGAPDVATILECPYREGGEEAATVLMAALAQDLLAAGKRSIEGALPRDHALCSPTAPWPARLGVNDFTMVRPYSALGTEAEQALRREAEGRFVYWIADYF